VHRIARAGAERAATRHPGDVSTVAAAVHARGCCAATHELLAAGIRSRALTAAVRRRDVVRARQGHYVCAHVDPTLTSAVRVGGRLAGVDAVRRHGVWTPNLGRPLTVSVPPHARALRSPDDPRRRLAARDRVRARWSEDGAPGTRLLVGPVEALRVALREVDDRLAFAMLESALYEGVLSPAELRRLLLATPARRRGVLGTAGRMSESGAESLLAFDLRVARIPFVQQVHIAQVGRVDIVVGTGLVLEADGGEHHATREGFEEDRRRDALLAAAGYRVLRFSARQLELRPDEVAAAIRRAMQQGDHRR
jgi:very-short-patch-repair endonuclease